MLRRVILDTDVGSDVDDALALAVILGSPELSLEAVTTVYGDTALRARIVRRLGALAGRSLTVAAGDAMPLSGRPIWWAGHEGSMHAGLDTETIDGRSGVAVLRDAVLASPGELDVVAIGPLTNIARAIRSDPGWAPAVRHLWVMGGIFDGRPGFDGSGLEHNFRSDADAAALVFSSGIPTTIASIEATDRLRLGLAEVERLEAAGPLGQALGADVRQWWARWDETENVPHDPLIVLALAGLPGIVFSQSGRVTVTPGAEGGLSVFTPDAAGTTRLIADLDPAAVVRAIVERAEAASRSDR